MNQVTYFGRGPEENYIDRNNGTLVDLYKNTADNMYFPYVRHVLPVCTSAGERPSY